MAKRSLKKAENIFANEELEKKIMTKVKGGGETEMSVVMPSNEILMCNACETSSNNSTESNTESMELGEDYITDLQ